MMTNREMANYRYAVYLPRRAVRVRARVKCSVAAASGIFYGTRSATLTVLCPEKITEPHNARRAHCLPSAEMAHDGVSVTFCHRRPHAEDTL